MKIEEITFWTYPENQGDGSACCRIFPTKEQARQYQEKCEKYEGWAEDCVEEHTVKINNDGSISLDAWYLKE